MKMIASAKLRRAQAAIDGKLPYERQLYRILAGLLQDDDLQNALGEILGLGRTDSHSPVVLQDVGAGELPSPQKVSRVALVAVSSSSSLCGAFNSNVIKMFRSTLKQLQDRGYSLSDVDIYAVGKKIADAAEKDGISLKADLSALADKPDYEGAYSLASDLVDAFSSGEVSQVILIYNHFASAGSQPTVRENYLPLALHDFDEGDEPVDFIIEPDPLSVVHTLLPQVLLMKMYTVLLDASAAEHAARTLAMQIASDNAEDLISELTLAYNKGRQQEITAEILDLVGSTLA